MANYSLNHRKFLEEKEWRHLEDFLRGRLAATDLTYARKRLAITKRTERRDALMILIALRSGARASEVLRLKPEDFMPKSNRLFFIGLKGSKDREIVLPEYLASAIGSYLKDNPALKLIFPIHYMTLHYAWTKYRPNRDRNFHSLRHTFGLNAYKKTKDIRLVQHALGHKSITNTLIYVDYAYSSREMRKLIF
jgi:integrase